MNFSGCYQKFFPPIRPTRISFSVRVEAGCQTRSFFNVFFSSAAHAYSGLSAFYAGTPAVPPEPSDVFSFLVDTQNGENVEETNKPMLWLPSGEVACWSGGLAFGEWHRVCLELSWGPFCPPKFAQPSTKTRVGQVVGAH